jgi:hypothetical protein
MEAMTTESEALKVEKLLQGYRESVKPYAQARSERVYFEHFRQSKKAELKIEARKNGVKSDCEAEDYAYAHHDYIQLLTALSAATEKEAKYGGIIEGCKLAVSLYQTQKADERAERKAYQ